ncbi:MAG: glycoside hydrolase family 57 protein [Candidatus Zixiibacteriota bacterium]
MGKPYVALLWHFHQPPYADPSVESGELALPWVRLHAGRDYYQMGHVAGEVEGVRTTFNFTPVLLAQFDAYLNEGRRDRLMDLSLRSPARLAPAERDALVKTSFDADFRHEIRNHPRYFKLFRKYVRGEAFSDAELTDAVACFNLAWLGEIFREGPVKLATGEVVDVAELFGRGGGYTRDDVDAIISAQLRIMAAVVPLYTSLREAGRVELSTTPFYHPILPLVHDSDLATIDRPGAVKPPRFNRPEDAREQVTRGLDFFEGVFGYRPVGMWPAEGAVAEEILPHFEEAGVRWIASDEGVLALSAGSGSPAVSAEKLTRPYRVGGDDLVAFFRHHGLSDAIGFEYQHWGDPAKAAADFAARLCTVVGEARGRTVRDVLVSVILDGENAWGSYSRQGVPFLKALYRRLARGDVARLVTFAEYLDGAPARELAPHPPVTLDRLERLACASWIDEAGSLPGNDLGTWAGESDENAAWGLLGEGRAACDRSRAAENDKRRAREYLLAAEASDWFWWYGEDQGGGADEEFDRLFREYVRAAYRALGEEEPVALDVPLSPRRVVWRPDRRVTLRPGDLLVVQWPGPGMVRFGVDGWRDPVEVPLAPATGVMAGPGSIYRAPLLRITEGIRRVEFTFRDAGGEWLGYDFFILID